MDVVTPARQLLRRERGPLHGRIEDYFRRHRRFVQIARQGSSARVQDELDRHGLTGHDGL